MRSIVLLMLVGGVASAEPFSYESGLLPFPTEGSDARLGPPVSADGVESPNTTWRNFSFGVQGDAFITYKLTHAQDQTTSSFELTRLQLTGWAAWGSLAGVNVTLESIRSSGSSSYIGIGGDSLIPRFKYVFAEATPLKQWLALRAGMIPDLLLPWVESAWAFRVQGPTGIERDGMFTTGDLGASAEAALPGAFGSVAVMYGNGEGTHQPEQNNGKNTTVALHLRPGGLVLPQVVLHLVYRDGSIGAGSASDRRLAGGITYEGKRLGAGAIGTWAMGWNGLGSRDAAHLTVFARAELPFRFYLFGRIDSLWPDTSQSGAVQMRLIGGAAYALPALVRLVVSYEGTLPFGSLPFGSLVTAVPSLRERTFLAHVEARL